MYFRQLSWLFDATLNLASVQAFELDTDLKQTILSEVLTCEAMMRHTGK